MASVCISNCINDARLPVPVRPTYRNLYNWPESDAEFIRSVSSKVNRASRVVDSIYCRQMYLRSYTFSRDDDDVPEKTNKCFAKLGMRQKKLSRRRKKKAAEDGDDAEKIRKCSALKKAKELSCAAFTSVFRRLLSCTAKVDVADNVREFP
ncbi:uncharacterized protein LOC111015497 [Momordica charantia]|uniref:Uncharacterized protein LOC111015497 n=1 Tax=Momordica charantia TaxID=3673 RepID=A0A6J1CY16_MOMCH|nr:uncharacterized protein LOC111015497 [Momordica charantia]